MSKKKKKETDPLRQFLLSELFKTFNKHPNRSFNYKQLVTIIRADFVSFLRERAGDEVHFDELNDDLKKDVQFLLAELLDKGDLLESEPGKFKLKPKHAYVEGIIDITSGGAAYLLSENDEDDIYIAPRNVKNAL
jgi:ribonuclease R